MSQAILDRLIADRDQEVAAVDAILDREDADLSDPGLVAAREKIETLNRSIKARADFEKTRASGYEISHIVNRVAGRKDAEQVKDRSDDLSMGEMFIRSDEFKSYRGHGSSSTVEVRTRALPTGLADLTAAIPQPQRITLDNVEGPAPLLGMIPAVPVSTNSLEVVTFDVKVGGAAVVAEKGSKPSVEYQAVTTPITLDTIAVYTQLTRQLIEDAPAVRSLIDSEMRRDVLRKMEAEAAAALAAATLPTATGADLLKAIRVGVGTVQAAGYSPNVVLLNPADWATLDVSVLGSTLIGPSVGSQFWGLRPVASVAQPAGTATVGDFAAGAARYTRTGVHLYITDSHADTFIKNVFTLLAEARAKTVVTRPAAFVECTKTP